MAQLAAIVVLYKQIPAESVALQMLLAGFQGREDCLQLMVYDNSPQSQAHLLPSISTFDINIEYFHDANNGRLIAAYTHALGRAACHNLPWLMLLDQDTEITPSYIDEALLLCSQTLPGICAITPRLLVHGEQRSPHLHAQLNRGDGSDGVLYTGRSEERVAAWNSGAIFRVTSLLAIGGFPREFPLDNLDYAMFLLLQQGEERVFVMESRLNHQLSVADLHSLSAERLRNKLASDILFQRRFRQRTRFSLALEFLRTGISLLRKLPDKRMGLMCLQSSVACLLAIR